MKSCSICQRVNDPFAVTCVACGEGSWDETHVAIAPSKPAVDDAPPHAPPPDPVIANEADPSAPVAPDGPPPAVSDPVPAAPPADDTFRGTGPRGRRGR